MERPSTDVVEVMVTGYCVVRVRAFRAEGDGTLADLPHRRVRERETELMLRVPDCGRCAVLEAHHVVLPGLG